MAKKDEAKGEGEAAVVETADSPLLDLTDAAVKRMLKIAKKRGWVTQDELNAVLPSEEISSDQIEDMNAMLSEMGINVVDSEDAEEAEKESSEARRRGRGRGRRSRRGGALDRGRDPHVPSPPSAPTIRCACICARWARSSCLSREGEIAIAKRIEAGREAMIAGLCESPLTFQAIIIWRDELNDGKILLRDIIDLEATYAGPDGKKPPKIDYTAPGAPPRAAILRARPHRAGDRARRRRRPASRAKARRRRKASTTRTISRIRSRCRRWRPTSSRRCSRPSTASPTPTRSCAACRTRTSRTSCRSESLSPAQERKYKALKKDIVADVKSLSLNQNRIDALVEQLYDINKRLIGLDVRLMRMAEAHRVGREDFLKNYQNSELDPKWLLRVSKLGDARLEGFRRHRQDPDQGDPRRDPVAGDRDRPRDPGIPQARADGAEGRARGAAGEEGDGRGEPAPRHLDRQEIHQPRPAVPRPDPGRQHRPDEGGRQVRVPPRLQVLDLRHLVDSAGDHPLDRRSGAHDPHSGAHDRDDQQDRAHLAPDAARDRPRADAGGALARSSPCRSRRCARC